VPLDLVLFLPYIFHDIFVLFFSNVHIAVDVLSEGVKVFLRGEAWNYIF
jgi:hypothetical protein